MIIPSYVHESDQIRVGPFSFITPGPFCVDTHSSRMASNLSAGLLLSGKLENHLVSLDGQLVDLWHELLELGDPLQLLLHLVLHGT